MTVDQIVEEARHWPEDQVVALMDRLTEALHTSSPEVEAAWKAEISHRIEEIQTGQVKGIDVEESLARIRKLAGQ